MMPPKPYPPVTLHLGAHRSASSSLQRLLVHNRPMLAAERIALWTPAETRAGLMTGVLGDPGRIDPRRDVMAHRAAGRVSMLRDAMRQDGVSRLVVSDENMLGGLRENLLLGRLYPTAAARLARIRLAVPGVDRVFLAIRSPDAWWTSAFAFLMTRGFAPPDRITLDAVLRAGRGWRKVIEDVARTFPDAEITVWTYEETGASPDRAFEVLTGVPADAGQAPRLNTSPGLVALQARLRDEGCVTILPGTGDAYAPFSPDERAHLRDAFAADLAWLRNGADGLVKYRTRGARTPPARQRKGTVHVRIRGSQNAMGASG
ncbi:MAG: hypothetical protein WBA67_10145 [Jannaschia sp.]